MSVLIDGDILYFFSDLWVDVILMILNDVHIVAVQEAVSV